MSKQEIISQITKEIGRSDLRLDLRFDEIGMDSLELLELMTVFEVPYSELGNIATAGDLADYLSRREASRILA